MNQEGIINRSSCDEDQTKNKCFRKFLKDLTLNEKVNLTVQLHENDYYRNIPIDQLQ